MCAAPRERAVFLGRLPRPERAAVGAALRSETVGGLVLLAAAVAALVWANSPWSAAYATVRDFRFGLLVSGLDLSVQQWAWEGLLTIFFLVAGVELKRELLVGELRSPAAAAVPVVAAVVCRIIGQPPHFALCQFCVVQYLGWGRTPSAGGA